MVSSWQLMNHSCSPSTFIVSFLTYFKGIYNKALLNVLDSPVSCGKDLFCNRNLQTGFVSEELPGNCSLGMPEKKIISLEWETFQVCKFSRYTGSIFHCICDCNIFVDRPSSKCPLMEFTIQWNYLWNLASMIHEDLSVCTICTLIVSCILKAIQQSTIKEH